MPIAPRTRLPTGYWERVPSRPRARMGGRQAGRHAWQTTLGRAMAAGRVTFAGLVAGIPVVSLTHAGGSRSTYEPVNATVAVGDQVVAGQQIGLVAEAGGHCGGEAGCVHVGLRDSHGYRDPTPLLANALLKTLRHRRGDGPAGR